MSDLDGERKHNKVWKLRTSLLGVSASEVQLCYVQRTRCRWELRPGSSWWIQCSRSTVSIIVLLCFVKATYRIIPGG